MFVSGFKELFKCPNYIVKDCKTDGEILQVKLAIDRRFKPKCPHCLSKTSYNSISNTSINDLPFGIAKYTILLVEVAQCRCFKCGKTNMLRPALVGPYQRNTIRLMQLAAGLCQYMPCDKVAMYLGYSDSTIRRWNKQVLTEKLGEVNLDGIKKLMVDEKSIGKGHRYVTVVLNGKGDLLHFAEGKKKASLQSLFDKMSDEQKASIEAVCIDRSGAYSQCIAEQLPQAEIVYDKFHLVKNFNEVIDKIRRNVWNELRNSGQQEQADYIKGQRFNLLRDKSKNTAKQQAKLDGLLKINAPLSESYILLENFRYALSAKESTQLHTRLLNWLLVADKSSRKEIVSFANNLVKVFRQVVNGARFNLNNGQIESFNNKIARVIHRACGCRDLDYLFLNLRQLNQMPIPI